MEAHSLGYRTDLMVRRLAGSAITERDGYIVVRTPLNPRFYWGNFLLFPSPPAGAESVVDEWVAAFRGEFPDAGYIAIAVDGSAPPGPGPYLASSGLEAEVAIVLTAGRLQSPAPPGAAYELRALHSDDDWRQVLELRLGVSREDGPLTADHQPFLERSTAEARSLVAAGHGSYVGAFSDRRLCSMVGIVSDGGGVARFQNVATALSHRRRGLAGNLVVQAGALGRSAFGAETLVIVADAEGPAAGLYRSLGFDDAEYQIGLSRSPRQSKDSVDGLAPG